MLSPREDDDDDSHLCIKCNATIVGLENYIKHRKEKCGKKPEKPELPPIDPLEPIYSLGADVFFQSLELQSSVKKTSLSRLTPPISKGNLERKSLAVPSTSRDIPRMSPLEANLRGGDWIGGHSLRIGSISNEDNQTKLINAVASISGTAKKEISTSTYNIPYNDYKGDDDSEESDDLDDDDDDEVHATAGKWKPPPNYTGGKWRPVSPEHEEWSMRDDQEHTGGKWKPIMTESNDRDDDFDAPPPGHTKGKWVPGANEKTQIMQTTIQSKGSVQYWCGPCNRRLGSKSVYEKHLRSNLHMRKVLPEHELEFSGHLDPVRSAIDKRTTKPSRFIDESIYSRPVAKQEKSPLKLPIVKPKRKRKRKFQYVVCSGCKCRVRLHLMGKHLISHYHFRKAFDTKSFDFQKLICDNIESIVHQSPFQCSPCKFYSNWLTDFIQHWVSEEHEAKMLTIEGRYWCSFCKFECDTSQEMLQHMSSNDHSEVIAAINRSMPIIIRKKSVILCQTCQKEFRYNIEMKRHCLSTGHKMAFTGTDDYQDTVKCQTCGSKFISSVALAFHLKFTHKQNAYVCIVCSLTFDTALEAKLHRQTSEHRIRRKEKMKEKGLPVKDMSKKCPYCIEPVILKNVIELKKHLKIVHPNIKKKCPTCGMSFTLPQEVTSHVRSKACQFRHSPVNSSILWNCSQCLFTTDSQAECFYHEVLHSDPKNEVQISKDQEKVIQKYTCPLCPKEFRKESLRHHLRQHTFERPFVCNICGANFTRQGSLVNHTKNEHGSTSAKELKLKTIAEEPTQDGFSCGQCQKWFESKSEFSRHLPDCRVPDDRHCPYEHCTYIAANSKQMARHRRSHGERVKHHLCPFCSFKTDQSSHLKRHLICHGGSKPYGCPYCVFTCGSLENLRKHVLRGPRHQGLYLYKCESCTYQTNMAKDLREHLVLAHPEKYNQASAMHSVKMHLIVKNMQNTETIKSDTVS